VTTGYLGSQELLGDTWTSQGPFGFSGLLRLLEVTRVFWGHSGSFGVTWATRGHSGYSGVTRGHLNLSGSLGLLGQSGSLGLLEVTRTARGNTKSLGLLLAAQGHSGYSDYSGLFGRIGSP